LSILCVFVYLYSVLSGVLQCSFVGTLYISLNICFNFFWIVMDNLDIFESQKGKEKLAFRKFMYVVHKERVNFIRWKCCKINSHKCPCILKTSLDKNYYIIEIEIDKLTNCIVFYIYGEYFLFIYYCITNLYLIIFILTNHFYYRVIFSVVIFSRGYFFGVIF